MAAIKISPRTGIELALLILVAAVSIYAHAILGIVCPLPWPDESHFLWPAISLAENGTLHSVELNPERAIYWMPPGYMTIMGGVFALTGGSLISARLFSLVCVLLSFLLVLKILRQFNCSILSSLLAGCFFLNAYFIACGNIARMEALLLLFVLAGFALLFEKKTLVALGLLAFTPLIHPNGLYFLASAITYAAIDWWRSKSRPQLTKPAIASLLATLAAWVGYIIHCAGNWPLVAHDLEFQFLRKSERDILSQVLTADNLALLIVLIFALALSTQPNRRRLLLLVVAAPCWAVHVIGFEMWYRVFWMVAALIITVLFVESAREFATTPFAATRRYIRFALISVPVCAAVGWHFYRGHLESPVNYPYQMAFFEMKTPDGIPYLTAADKSRVRNIINSEAAARPVTVQFFPRAEALFYLDLRSDRILFSDPLFCKRRADLYILHESKYLAPRWQWFLSNDMKDAGMFPEIRWDFIAYERDDHERWYVYKQGQ